MPNNLSLALVLVVYSVGSAFAQLKPTTPGPGERYAAGSSCKIAWVPDSSGTWKNVTIDLMSGSNLNMSLVMNVISDLDGTNSSLTPYLWTCPEVDPYSAIYFYQFTNGNNITSRTWTSRFSITSPSNETNPPANPNQPNGDAIPWGIGHVKDMKSETNSSSASSTSSIDSNDSAAQSILALPSTSDTSESSERKAPHKHKSDSDYSGDTKKDNEDQNTNEQDEEDYDSGDSSASATSIRYANTKGAESAAARATAMVHQHTTSPYTSPQDDPEYKTGDEDFPPTQSREPDSTRTAGSPRGSSYKNSGEADEADRENEDPNSKCHCGYTENSSSVGLKRGSIGLLVVLAFFTLEVTFI